MAGTKEGGRAAAEKNRERDPDHYRKIALKAQESWERNGRKPRGFATASKKQLSEWGRKGGTIGGRQKAINARKKREEGE